MKEIVLEQNERRKSELDALQSQINPHFLYNALESITWMVEGERNEEAVFMISQLARLFRIDLFCPEGHVAKSKPPMVFDSRGSRQMDMQACPPGSLPAEINKTRKR